MSEGRMGADLAGALGVAFVVLRLLGKIDWPWVWVLAPFWIPLAVVAVICVVVVLVLIAKGGMR